MNELALFAGVGGGLLGARLLGWKTVCAVEINKFCRDRLMQRQNEGLLDPFPIWDDLRTFDGHPWRGCVDVVTAGFPCPAFSSARGKFQRNPFANPKNLWPETIRVINEIQPPWILLENVAGLLSGSHGYLGKILRDLSKGGYDAEWDTLSAGDEGADHIRDRVWICCHRRRKNCSDASENHAIADAITNTNGTSKSDQCGTRSGSRPIRGTDRGPWEIQPGSPRLADGVADWVERLRATGNAQVPAVVARAWCELTNRNE